MTDDQIQIAVPLLNSYAHQYLGLSPNIVGVAAGCRDGTWMLIVATAIGVAGVATFDEAKALIDGLLPACDGDQDVKRF